MARSATRTETLSPDIRLQIELKFRDIKDFLKLAQVKIPVSDFYLVMRGGAHTPEIIEAIEVGWLRCLEILEMPNEKLTKLIIEGLSCKNSVKSIDPMKLVMFYAEVIYRKNKIN